jgi:hypothetical protein
LCTTVTTTGIAGVCILAPIGPGKIYAGGGAGRAGGSFLLRVANKDRERDCMTSCCVCLGACLSCLRCGPGRGLGEPSTCEENERQTFTRVFGVRSSERSECCTLGIG